MNPWESFINKYGLWNLWYQFIHGEFGEGKIPFNIPWVTQSENFDVFEYQYKNYLRYQKLQSRAQKLTRILK